MKIKKIFVFLLLCSVILFTGCAKVQYQHVFKSDGTVVDAVMVELDEDVLQEKDVNISALKSKIENTMAYFMEAFINSFYSRDDGLTLEEKNSVFANVEPKVYRKENYIIAQFTFKNATAFTYFYGYHLDTDDDNIKTEESTFYNTSISEGKTIFSADMSKNICNEFLTALDDKFTLEDTTFYYTFGTTYSRIHSNSTYKFDKDGVYYHQWQLNSVDDTIMTYTVGAKPINWYILALALTFVLGIVLFVISLFSKRKTNKTKQISQINSTYSNITGENEL